MMDYMALLYLAAFPLVTVAIGWSVLANGLLATDDKLALRRVQRWRFILAFACFSIAWLLMVSSGLYTYNQLAYLAGRDVFATMAVIAAAVWLACTGYWLALLYAAGDVLHLPKETARRAASSTLLWNLLLTVPFFAFNLSGDAEPLKLIAGF